MSNETEILILKERIRIHELQIQALGEALRFANTEFYNTFANTANKYIDNDALLKEIRTELGIN